MTREFINQLSFISLDCNCNLIECEGEEKNRFKKFSTHIRSSEWTPRECSYRVAVVVKTRNELRHHSFKLIINSLIPSQQEATSCYQTAVFRILNIVVGYHHHQ